MERKAGRLVGARSWVNEERAGRQRRCSRGTDRASEKAMGNDGLGEVMQSEEASAPWASLRGVGRDTETSSLEGGFGV